jgi:hypothetical protein
MRIVLAGSRPVGPSVTCKLRVSGSLNIGAGGTIGLCINIGSTISTLGDFTNAASVFGRFTITHVKFVILPNYGVN